MTICEGVFVITIIFIIDLVYVHYYCFSTCTLRFACCYCYYYYLISADVCAVLLINPTIAVTTNAIVKVGNVAPIVLSLCNI